MDRTGYKWWKANNMKKVILYFECMSELRSQYFKELEKKLHKKNVELIIRDLEKIRYTFKADTYTNNKGGIVILAKKVKGHIGYFIEMIQCPGILDAVNVYDKHEAKKKQLKNAIRVDLAITKTHLWKYCSNMKKVFEIDVMKRDPSLIFLWCQFKPEHLIARSVAEEKNIPVGFVHEGLLPGSISYDYKGEMAESKIYTEYKDHLTRTISDEDTKKTYSYLEEVRLKEVNRKEQPKKGMIQKLIKKHKIKRDTLIFYAGTNDYESGIFPEAGQSRRIHSPIYKNTFDALKHLDTIAAKKGYKIIFKPHPLIKYEEGKTSEFKNIFMVEDANVFECIAETVVTVTILSQVSYIAMIQEKPVVVLGNSPINKSNSVYAIQKEEELEAVLDTALKCGITGEMKKNWIDHVTRLRKFYLFGYHPELAKYFDRDLSIIAEEILDRLKS
jgi:hypothetical protein